MRGVWSAEIQRIAWWYNVPRLRAKRHSPPLCQRPLPVPLTQRQRARTSHTNETKGRHRAVGRFSIASSDNRGWSPQQHSARDRKRELAGQLVCVRPGERRHPQHVTATAPRASRRRIPCHTDGSSTSLTFWPSTYSWAKFPLPELFLTATVYGLCFEVVDDSMHGVPRQLVCIHARTAPGTKTW